MASNNKSSGFVPSTSNGERSYFETQRAALLSEIGVSLEHTLSAINKLNRSLEGVIAVGNEFGSVEALWSTFETVMGHDANAQSNAEGEVGEQDEDKTQHGQKQDQHQIYEREHRGYQLEERNAERR